ncbi:MULTISPECIES: APC family permease [Rhodococcus]|uniref:APC family permease n=1 Tax=Rhodococcus oxybenzonivorans TaxID=1990687 RepID=A0AAE4V1F6_9NOCA|nr:MULTISPECIES: APC family permease [Rhodococcus]MDV7241777.1 APC family permease [Rhodococcus oxybenzonivorans]MDV7267060.1 APC family permease [Rhodococcus oxybenzonivorans]MDV7273689.1 APC family permease [Rhodococcus oxybenzonivorans]MDV7334059.1 APC family permease [Rhodococcus oxybenzonivorans]MDV7343478.1 APC family permease [Rhodococcus oxybenzonivorans]
MSKAVHAARRLVLGRALRSERLGEQSLSKRLALPIFASDPLSSVAYATQEILLILSLGGLAYLYLTPYLGAAVVVLLAVVVLSYRQVVFAYPSGGGSYEVANRNLGPSAGLTVASALLVDYVMTVAVSVAAGVDNLISAAPSLNEHRVALAAGFVVLLTAINLRGVRESGKAFAVPTYGFIAGVVVLIVTGLIRAAFGNPPVAESAAYTITAEHSGLTGLALIFFALRAFSSGCTALTGVEAISNGVPAFRKPKSANAAKTLVAMGATAIVMFSGVTALAIISKVRIAENTCDLTGFAGDCATDPQRTVIAQIAAAVFGGSTNVGFFYIQAATVLILILAANTAYNGFPLLASILARDRYLPRQLNTRGDRLAFSNGIILLALAAGTLIVIFDASVTHLIQLYILGVFTSFTLSQAGMVRHWNRLLRTTPDRTERHRIHLRRAVNGIGCVLTGLVLIIVTVTKFTQGAYLVVIAMPILFALMKGIRRHYDRVSAALVLEEDSFDLPSQVHAIVLISQLHKPAARALAYARATRPSIIEAVTVQSDDTPRLQKEWSKHDLPVPLKVLASPYREVTRPIINYIKTIRRDNPRKVITIYIPEYVVGHWWENLLHNQSALRLKGRLLYTPGVMVTSIPWLLDSAQRIRDPAPLPAPGDIRRGALPAKSSPPDTRK